MSDRPDHDDDATFEALDGDDLDLDDKQSVRERAYWMDPDWDEVPLPLVIANGAVVTVGGESGVLLIAPGLLVDAETRRRRGLCDGDDAA